MPCSYAPKDQEQDPKSEAELKKLVGSADLKYYDSINTRGCLVGSLTLLLFPILTFPLGWKVALVVTVLLFLVLTFVFHLRPVSSGETLRGGSLSLV